MKRKYESSPPTTLSISFSLHLNLINQLQVDSSSVNKTPLLPSLSKLTAAFFANSFPRAASTANVWCHVAGSPGLCDRSLTNSRKILLGLYRKGVGTDLLRPAMVCHNVDSNAWNWFSDIESRNNHELGLRENSAFEVWVEI